MDEGTLEVSLQRPAGSAGQDVSLGSAKDAAWMPDLQQDTENWHTNEHKQHQPLQDNAAPSPLTAYITRWNKLITQEHEADKALVQGRLANWPLSKLQQEGLVLLGLTAARHGKRYGAPLWVLQLPSKGVLPMNKFTAGDEVLISKGDPLRGKPKPFKGIVVEKNPREIRLTSTGQLPTDGTELRLDKEVNTIVYQRMRTALKSLKKNPPTHQEVQQASAAVKAAVDEPASESEASSGADDDDDDNDDKTDEVGRLYSSWPLLISLQLEQQWQQQLQKDRALRRKLARRETKKRRREQRRQSRQRKKVQQLRQKLNNLQQQQRHGTSLVDVLVCPSATAAAGPSGIMPSAAVDWAKGVLAQHAQREEQQHGSQSVDPAERDPELELNKSQLIAIANSIANKLSLIHGPPGTGKTTTTVALIAQLIKRWELPCPVLAVAQSHVAVDNLLEGLVNAGVNAVRLGQPVRVRESLRGATLDALLEAHPGKLAAEELLQQLRSLQGKDKLHGKNAAAAVAARASNMRAELMADVLRQAQVICVTCAASGSDMLAGASFPVVVLDEASQASEPEALIPITRGAEHVVLVGDHFQLPPVCISEEAAAAGLSVSLFDRLMAAGVPSAMLQVQYRMHPCLSAFPNAAFYSNRLLDGVSGQQRPSPQPFPWPQPDRPLLFVDVPYGLEQVDASGSKFNKAEAAVVQQVLMHLLQVSGESRGSLAVVVPYVAQLNLLNRILADLIRAPAGCDQQQQQRQYLPPPVTQQQQHQQRGLRVTGSAAAATTAAAVAMGNTDMNSNGSSGDSSEAAADVLEIKTVDGYQGREKEVVVFSAVRANSRSQVGFLEDWRRLNVAITRPRRGLVLIGHAATLAHGSETWGRYLAWLQCSGCMVSADQIQQRMAAAAAAARRAQAKWVRQSS